MRIWLKACLPRETVCVRDVTDNNWIIYCRCDRSPTSEENALLLLDLTPSLCLDRVLLNAAEVICLWCHSDCCCVMSLYTARKVRLLPVLHHIAFHVIYVCHLCFNTQRHVGVAAVTPSPTTDRVARQLVFVVSQTYLLFLPATPVGFLIVNNGYGDFAKTTLTATTGRHRP